MTNPQAFLAIDIPATHPAFNVALETIAVQIQELMLAGSGVGCDSEFGEFQRDLRIPIHYVNSEDFVSENDIPLN
ncbi:hypothetical protein AB4254_11840 [Vibrio breoganii]